MLKQRAEHSGQKNYALQARQLGGGQIEEPTQGYEDHSTEGHPGVDYMELVQALEEIRRGELERQNREQSAKAVNKEQSSRLVTRLIELKKTLEDIRRRMGPYGTEVVDAGPIEMLTLEGQKPDKAIPELKEKFFLEQTISALDSIIQASDKRVDEVLEALRRDNVRLNRTNYINSDFLNALLFENARLKLMRGLLKGSWRSEDLFHTQVCLLWDNQSRSLKPLEDIRSIIGNIRILWETVVYRELHVASDDKIIYDLAGEINALPIPASIKDVALEILKIRDQVLKQLQEIVPKD